MFRKMKKMVKNEMHGGPIIVLSAKNVSELPNDLLEVKVSVLFLLLVLAAVFGKESLDWWHLMQMCSNCITMQRSLCQESQLPK